MAGQAMAHVLVILNLLSLSAVIAKEYVTIETPSGPLRGLLRTTQTDQPLFSFRGIPYAEPPVGDLRFQPPVSKVQWTEVRDAIDVGSTCPQYRNDVASGDEDCLFLNVYGPGTPGPSKSPKTVMVWIHGGCFTGGTGNNVKPDYFVDNDIIFVSINYRLGLLGFLSTGDQLVPGNMGLKDQAEALRWVQKNIAAFGGDPNRVTIFGQSAGGASIHYQVLSPLSKGLFKNAISMSGAGVMPWAFSKNATDRAIRFAEHLGYSPKNTADLVDYLNTVDAYTLVLDAKTALNDEDKNSQFYCVWVPSAEPEHEGAFLTEEPAVLVAEGRYNHVPYIAGGTDLERLSDTQEGGKLSTQKKIDKLNDNFAEMIGCDLRLPTREERLSGGGAVKSFYYNDKEITLQDNYTTAQFLSHLHFAEGVDTVVRSMAKYSSAPVFYYDFTYNGPLSKFPGAPGAAHGDDSSCMFSSKHEPDSDGAIIRDQMTAMFANFAKYDHPTPELSSLLTVNWTQYNVDSRPYLKITAPLSMEKDLFASYMNFWHDLLPQ